MTGIIDWCSERARMVLAFVVISVAAGIISYISLPKEGAPNIDIPVLYISVPLPGISAIDAERLIVKPLETEMRGIEGLEEMTGIATENHASILLEFDFGWDKQAVLADVRDKLDQAEAEFPEDAEEATIFEVNLSEFPVVTISLSGEAPERTLTKLAKDMQRALEAVPSVLEVSLEGHRDEMIEVEIDPLRLESYNVTTTELLNVIDRNNILVAAGAVENGTAEFSVSVPGAFETVEDVHGLPIKISGDRIVRLSDVADIRRTFEDPEGRARYNGEKSISLQISKRIGENIIDTVTAVRAVVAEETAKWPQPLRDAVALDIAMDESREVVDMIGQLESSVMTAVILVMLVVLASLGFRSSLLVGIAVPCSFLLSFGLMGALGMTVSNMTMFGLILAVGMLVDGAIVVVEYADKRIKEGEGPMKAYTAAAKRMFWPITASTATTLCAFLPMIFWPGMPGEFMGQLPVTLIFVLSASLIVALIFLPVLGGIAGRITRLGDTWVSALREASLRTKMLIIATFAVVGVVWISLISQTPQAPMAFLAPALLLLVIWLAFGPRKRKQRDGLYRRSTFGHLVSLIVKNPVGPVVALIVAIVSVAGVMSYYGKNQNGTEFFVETDPTRVIVYVRARGNNSLEERDRLVRMVEERVLNVPGIASTFAFSGEGGLTTGGTGGPRDAIGQLQFELVNWRKRGPGEEIVDQVRAQIADLPGIKTEVFIQEDGPQQGKPIQLEIRSNTWEELLESAAIARARFENTEGLVEIDDTRPLPGIEWQITVDRATAGRYGADIATVGPMVQFVTRGATLDTYRPDDLDEEIDIRARFPREDRNLSTLDELRISTDRGLVPLANFITRKPVPKLAEISRRDTERYFLIRAEVDANTSENEKIAELQAWVEEEQPFPTSVSARFVGDWEEQQESQAFLTKAFAGALGLMFVILLAQFNSVYNAVLVLSAVVMSVAGVLIGMLVMDQKFSIIMTGTGIVALAGIVVNNNIVLIDTFQEFAKRMDRLEAIVRTAEARIRPVLLTTITTMAGLTPMMFAMSLDFANGQISFGAPTALWWTQLATAVVWGLGVATLLTLLVTPAALAIREWATLGCYASVRMIAATMTGTSPYWRDRRLTRALRKASPGTTLIWDEGPEPQTLLRAAE
ncbi:MAG: efflux RND transporter permease subunit [Pseudomonadota bacterium]